MSPDRVVIGTRGSALALWQADRVASLLRAAHPGLVVERSTIVTTGDRTPQGPVWEAGGKAVWVKEIEAALLAGEIDVAVHSLKDVPAELAPGLALAAIPTRADVRDAVVSHDGATLADLPAGARVGTTSLRRSCQVKALRPDLRLEPLRGNLDTRLRKVADGRVDAAILACAGLDRLGLSQHIAERIPVERMLPAIGQGALAIEIRAADEDARILCRALASEEAEIAVTAERALLHRLGAGCRTPVAGTACLQQGKLEVWGLVGRPDGATMLHEHVAGPPSAAQALGRALAEALLARGADRILAEFR
ncbi:MAG TPA: hydroxymethylbilane synthase [Polyangia bacterium]|nr:hydroxymethylbilane synthase [Polyangia bacterium]